MLDGVEKPASPWHEGEIELQRSVGVAEQMEPVGRRVLRTFLLDQHREFYPLLPFIAIGSVDPDGWPWATIRAGKPGFMHSPDPLTLTVEAGQAGSHQGKGWEKFTDAVIRAVNDLPQPVVFILWGSYAQKKAAFVDTSKHLVIKSVHPSPLSAHNGFFGTKPFSRANDFLVSKGYAPIDWKLPDDPAISPT